MNSGTIFDIPIVYTTRLDEMIILREDLSVARPRDVIQAIIYESKPQYKVTDPINGAKILKNKQNKTYEDKSKLKNKKDISSEHVQQNPAYKLTFKELKAKLNEIKYEPQNSINETEVDIKSEIETFEDLESTLDVKEIETNGASSETEVGIKSEIEIFDEVESKLDINEIETNSASSETEVVLKSEIETVINFEGTNKLESLLALCKPLKIVLIDISKVLPKKINNEIKSEILNISSDSEDDVVFVEEMKVTPNSISVAPQGKNLTNTPNHFLINNINDLKNILTEIDLQDCVIVIYNLFLKVLDAYQIDKCYKVTEHKTRKYTEVHKFPMKKCDLVINIITCCWKNRNCYASLLLKYDKYINIAGFITDQSAHLCTKLCTSCTLEQNTQPTDEINKPIENDISTNLVKNSHAISRIPKLIAHALKFQKKSKWKGSPEVASGLNVTNKHICNKSIQFHNANGEAEFYELGRDNIIYSKVIKNVADKSSWLYKTMNQCENPIYFRYKDQTDRESKILPYKNINNMISYETECFLRKPYPVKACIKTNCGFERDNTYAQYEVRHIRYFTRASCNKSQVLSILPTLQKRQVPSRTLAKRKAPTRSQPVTRKPRVPQPEQNIMNEQVSDTVNHIVKDILHRFRDVLLTINSDGKVSAALNAPLSSLSRSELEILSQILSHAQIQVDKLGLTPGTCLNPNAAIRVNSTGEMSSILKQFTNSSAVDATDSEKRVKHNKQSLKENINKKEKNKFLSIFSTITANKKKEYEMSFRSYLGDTVHPTPQITNVFTLDVGNSIASNVLGNQIEDTAVMIDTDDIFTNKLSDTTFVENTASTVPKNRKRRTYSKGNEKEPKIRIKTTPKMIVDNAAAVETPLGPCDIEIVEYDPLQDLTPIDVQPDASNIPDNIPLQEIKTEIETYEVLEPAEYDSVPQNILIVHADGTMSDNTIFLDPQPR